MCGPYDGVRLIEAEQAGREFFDLDQRSFVDFLKTFHSLSLAPADAELASVDKSTLVLAEPRRLRDKAHLKFVASQPCLVCGRQPSDPHHLRFAQPRAIGLKVSDEFTVPLCRGHHRQLHQAGNEETWWDNLRINAREIARGLWVQTHPVSATTPAPHDGDERAEN